MKSFRNLLIYLVLSVVMAVAAVWAVSWIPQSSGVYGVALGICGGIAGGVVFAVGRRLTGWPAHRPLEGYLPIRSPADGQWSVTVDEPPAEPTPIAAYLADAHGLGHADTLAALTRDPLPLLIAEGLPHHDAAVLARHLHDLGATVSIHGRAVGNSD